MKKQLLSIFAISCLTIISYAQPINIYQPNGSTTNFGKVTSDSLNYYVVNYPALTLMKIDGSNVASLVTTLTVDPFQGMIWNNGKGIYPVADGSPFKLFDGSTATDITGGQLPMAGYTNDKVILSDYFHKGNTTYFRTGNKIYKTDYTSAASIQTLATKFYASSVGISEMQHTTNSIYYTENAFPSKSYLKRIDITTGSVTDVDSSISTGSFDLGTVYNNEYYYCTPSEGVSVGLGKVYKVSDNGTKTTLYTLSAADKNLIRIIGVTPNGVIALVATTSVGSEYVSISGGIATPLNFNTIANSQPCGNVGTGGSTTAASLVYFVTLDTLYTVNSSNQALWVTDGTLTGTKKVFSGTPSTFDVNISPIYNSISEKCGDDLYFNGTKGADVSRLIYVNGSNYNVTVYPINAGASNSFKFRKTASGIYVIAAPLPTSSAEKAVFKINCGTILGITENSSNGLSFELFPNPSNGQITIKLPENSNNCLVTIHSILGELVYSEIIKDKLTSHNLNLKTGLYFVSVNNNGQKSTKKIVVE